MGPLSGLRTYALHSNLQPHILFACWESERVMICLLQTAPSTKTKTGKTYILNYGIYVA